MSGASQMSIRSSADTTSRRTDLAGQTVSSDGRNITYDEDGYVSSARNYNHDVFAGTDRSVAAPSIDAYSRGTAGSSNLDRANMSDAHLAALDRIRQRVARGEISAEWGNYEANNLRSIYGYSGGSDGITYSVVPKTVFNPDDATTQPMGDNFRANPTTNYGQWSGTALGAGDTVRLNSGQTQTAQNTAAQNALQAAYAQQQSRYSQLQEQYNQLQSQYQSQLSAYQNQAAQQYQQQLAAYQQQAAQQYQSQLSDYQNQLQSTYQQQLSALQGQYDRQSREQQSAQRAAEELAERYRGLYEDERSAYAAALAEQQAANDAAVQQAVNRLEAQKTDTNRSYADYARQAYIDKMNSQRNLNQRLAAQGVNGGAAESTLLGLETAYADALRQQENQRISAIGNLDLAINDARLTGDVTNAQAAADSIRAQTDSYAAVLQDLLSRYDAIAARQQAYDREDEQTAYQRAYQQTRDSLSDSRYADETAYNRYRDLINDSRYASETDYNRWRDAVADARYADALNYERGRDDVSDSRYADETAYNRQYQQSLLDRQDAAAARQNAYQQAWSLIELGVLPSDELLAAAGIDPAAARSAAERNQAQLAADLARVQAQTERTTQLTAGTSSASSSSRSSSASSASSGAAGAGDVYAWLARRGASDYGTAYNLLRNGGYGVTDANRYARYYEDTYLSAARQSAAPAAPAPSFSEVRRTVAGLVSLGQLSRARGVVAEYGPAFTAAQQSQLQSLLP